MPIFFPLSLNQSAKKSVMGVLPVPPTVIFPMTITGTETLVLLKIFDVKSVDLILTTREKIFDKMTSNNGGLFLLYHMLFNLLEILFIKL